MKKRILFFLCFILVVSGCKKQPEDEILTPPIDVEYDLIYGAYNDANLTYSYDFFRVTSSDSLESQICIKCETFDISYDGRFILCSSYGGGHSDRIVLADFDCRQQHLGRGRYGIFSPDESQIIFERLPVFAYGSQQSEVVKLNLTTLNEVSLSYGENPTWLYDGSKVLFNKREGSYLDGWIMGDDGSNPQKLLRTTYSFRTQLLYPSPIDDKIVYASEGSVYTVNSDGSNVTQILPDSAYFQEFEWAPDGSKIGFLRNSRLCVINSDGSDFLDIAYARYSAWSPDGMNIAYASAQGLFVINLESKQVIQVNSKDNIVFVEWYPQ